MRPINKIIVHHSATPDQKVLDLAAIRRYHMSQRGWLDIGYHFCIENLKTSGGGVETVAVVGRPLSIKGAHARGHNHDSIGICVIGNYNIDFVPEKHFEQAAKLCASLCIVFGLTANNVYGHRDFASTDCPGKLFDIERLRGRIYRLIEHQRGSD